MNYTSTIPKLYVTLGVVVGALALSSATGACTKMNAPQNGGVQHNEIPVGPVPGPKTPRALPQNPFGKERIAIEAGHKLFAMYNCSGCHGEHAGGGMGPSLRDKAWIYGKDDAHIFDSIVEGRAHGMPAWGDRVPEEQVWKIVSYLESLRTDDEPDPPTQPPAPPNP